MPLPREWPNAVQSAWRNRLGVEHLNLSDQALPSAGRLHLDPPLNMPQMRVLIVDDSEMFIEMAKFVLSAAAYEVESSPSASEALLQIPVFLPDLILMDVQMPIMDGIELTRQLKADPATKHIVIVAFTAYALKGDALKLQTAGFDGYIAKPVDVMTLAAEVRFWLEGPDSARGSHFVWP